VKMVSGKPKTTTLFESKWLVVIQNHHIVEIKLVSGHTKPPHENPKLKLGSLQP